MTRVVIATSSVSLASSPRQHELSQGSPRVQWPLGCQVSTIASPAALWRTITAGTPAISESWRSSGAASVSWNASPVSSSSSAAAVIKSSAASAVSAAFPPALHSAASVVLTQGFCSPRFPQFQPAQMPQHLQQPCVASATNADIPSLFAFAPALPVANCRVMSPRVTVSRAFSCSPCARQAACRQAPARSSAPGRYSGLLEAAQPRSSLPSSVCRHPSAPAASLHTRSPKLHSDEVVIAVTGQWLRQPEQSPRPRFELGEFPRFEPPSFDGPLPTPDSPTGSPLLEPPVIGEPLAFSIIQAKQSDDVHGKQELQLSYFELRNLQLESDTCADDTGGESPRTPRSFSCSYSISDSENASEREELYSPRGASAAVGDLLLSPSTFVDELNSPYLQDLLWDLSPEPWMVLNPARLLDTRGWHQAARDSRAELAQPVDLTWSCRLEAEDALTLTPTPVPDSLEPSPTQPMMLSRHRFDWSPALA